MKEQDLSPTSRALYLKAKQANEIGNYGYVSQLLQAVLKEAPGFLEARRLVRAAALAQNKGKKSAGFSIAGTQLSMTGGSAMKKDPLVAMEMAEKVLWTDPQNVAANQLLFEAANKAGFPHVASFALEALAGANPKDTKLLHQLASHYTAINEVDKAVNVYSLILQVNPADLEAQKRSKDASAHSTMEKGGWREAAEKGGSYKDLIKNKDETKSLAQQDRKVRTAEEIAQQVTEMYAQWEGQQSNIDLSRRIASLYEQWFETTLANNGPREEADSYLDSAIWFFGHTNELTNGGDANVARKKFDLELKKVDRRIEVLEEYLVQVGAEHAEHPDVKAVADEVETLKVQRANSLLDVAKKRVADNPTDLQLRFELGQVLFNAGKYSEAEPELQRAQQNPNARLKAINLLGQCFVKRNMLDLAVVQFKKAASEITAMDALKKDIMYQLGTAFEKLGKKDEYLNCMKEIYEVDAGYKDVAERVESSYGG